MVKWFKKRGPGRYEQTMSLQGEIATATRAMYQGPGQLPKIQMTFKVNHGRDEHMNETFDTVEIEMDLYASSEFIDQALTSLQAAMPKMPRTSRQTQFGE